MPASRELVRAAVAELTAAGIESAAVDARLLLAHVLGVEAGRLVLVESVEQAAAERFGALVARRARRIPVQHLTGKAYFRHVELDVGPGVFVPRPETEAMTGWAVSQLRSMVSSGTAPVVVELCAGSGAIAKALVTEVPGVVLHAVEVSAEAARWAAGNLAGTRVDLHVADMAGALPELNGQVSLVIANPPYIPLDAFESVLPEVRDHDPAVALFSGDDGLDAIRTVVSEAGRLLRDGGLLCFEHADVQEHSATAVAVESRLFSQVRDHRDLTGRPRFVTAVRSRAV
jgi:release factor glutamine methyltransferase